MKGERDSKAETKFARFDMAEPYPIFYKYTKSRSIFVFLIGNC